MSYLTLFVKIDGTSVHYDITVMPDPDPVEGGIEFRYSCNSRTSSKDGMMHFHDCVKINPYRKNDAVADLLFNPKLFQVVADGVRKGDQ